MSNSYFFIKLYRNSSSGLSTNSVSTNKINDNSITTAKIADDAVITSKISDGSITTEKISNDSITTSKIIDNSLDNNILAGESITNSKVFNIYQSKISGGKTFPTTIDEWVQFQNETVNLSLSYTIIPLTTNENLNDPQIWIRYKLKDGNLLTSAVSSVAFNPETKTFIERPSSVTVNTLFRITVNLENIHYDLATAMTFFENQGTDIDYDDVDSWQVQFRMNGQTTGTTFFGFNYMAQTEAITRY